MKVLSTSLLFIMATLAIGTRAEGILMIYPDHHGDWIRGTAAVSFDETLFLITEQYSRYAPLSAKGMYRLEARPMHNLGNILWSINLNELPGAPAAIDHAAKNSQLSDWRLVRLDDSLIIMVNLLSLSQPKPNLLFRVDKEGNVVADRELELYMPQHARSIRSVHLEPSQHGLVISYDSGIVVLNGHDLSTKATWILDQKSGPGLGSMVLSASAYDDEIFVVGVWVLKLGVNRLSVRVKKLALHPTIEEVGEVYLGITSNTWSTKTYDVLATEDSLLIIGGTDSWKLMACGYTKELITSAPCRELKFASSILERVETRDLPHYHPNLIRTSKGYVWGMDLERRLDDGLSRDHFIATKSNESASLRAFDPELDRYSFISSWSLIPSTDGNLFVLTSVDSYFDGHRYYSLELHTIPDLP